MIILNSESAYIEMVFSWFSMINYMAMWSRSKTIGALQFMSGSAPADLPFFLSALDRLILSTKVTEMVTPLTIST